MLNVSSRFAGLRVRIRSLMGAELHDARWFWTAVGITVLLLALCGLTVYVFNPYMRYHKKPLLSPVYDDEYRMVPHLLETADYDSLVAGSSMSLNFSLADVRQILRWQKPLKIAVRGCRAATHKLLCEKAFKNREVRHILTAVDVSILAKEPGSHYIPLEPWLYSRSLLHECAYLFNADIAFGANRDVIKAHLDNAPRLNPDLMFNTDDCSGRARYGKEQVLKALRSQQRSETRWIGEMKQHDATNLVERMMHNFDEGYLSLIRAHPETEFVLYYAPYSDLYWGCVLDEEMLDFLLDIKARINGLLHAYPNVKIFDFQAETAVVTDLSNYKDISHFSPAINRMILERIAAGANRYTPENAGATAEAVRAIARQGAETLRQMGL